MKLTIRDRLTIPSLFPETSNRITLSILSDIQKKISFNSAEKLSYCIKEKVSPEGNVMVNWKDGDYEPIEIAFTDSELSIIRSCIELLDGSKKLHMSQLETVKKF